MSATITVLHVDDDVGFTALLRDVFDAQFEGISVVSADQGSEAIDVLGSRSDIDCVVSDYEMPGMDGLELLERVRERWPTLPFILFTGRGDEETAIGAINRGVTDYLQKSSGVSQYTVLANRVENVVAHARVERELRLASQRTEAQFELLVDTVEEYAIFLLDPDGYIQTWNRGAEQIKGYAEAEVVGKHVSTFYRDEDVSAGVPTRLLRAAARDGRTNDEGWRVRKDGTEFWAAVTLMAMYSDGELVGYAKITRDSTQRYRERLLLERSERLHRLVVAVARDLRGTLTTAERGLQSALGAGELSSLDGAGTALTRAFELLGHLRTLATAGTTPMAPEPTDFGSAVTDAWAEVEADDASLRLDGDGAVVADRLRLQQLLEILLGNGVAHAPPGVTIRVGLLDDGFYVADDGPGISAEKRETVFETDESTTPDGAGFGLTVGRHIADAHGWSIGVTESADGGARVEVTGVDVR